MPLSGKNILVGITGGIAAYKTCELIRNLVKLNACVKAVMTPSAKEFITETTLRTLTKNPVYSEQFNVKNWQPEHISLADDSDLFVIAPASANTIGKTANGICDNLLTSLVCAFKKPVILAPAMNCNMWDSKAVQKNIQTLKDNGFYIIEPEIGELACGYEGKGRMAEPNKIVEKILKVLKYQQLPDLKGKKVIVTAGGTKEEIDPVRYISNYSSGKMGFALADAAFYAGADVVLVSTVSTLKQYPVIIVKSAEDMLNAVEKEFLNADILIMAAAVADYRPKERSIHKVKKENEEFMTIELVKTPDILKEMGKIKKDSQTIIGFCAETENLLQNAEKKLTAKNLDFIVANDVSGTETGFGSDYNEVTIINKTGKHLTIGKTLKTGLAKRILGEIFK